MKRNQWLAGILAAGLLCAMPLFGASAAPRARTRAAAPPAAGASSMVLTVVTGGPTCTYGGNVNLMAVYTPATGETVPTDAKVAFMCGNKALGEGALLIGPTAGNGTYVAMLDYATTGQGLAVGENTITASYTPANNTLGSTTAAVTGTAAVTLEKKVLTAKPGERVSYNGTAVLKVCSLR